VITGITYEINEYIRTFENNHTDFKVILTGGDSEFLKNKIDYQIIVIFGANGDLAKRKLIPAIFQLFLHFYKYNFHNLK